MNSAEPVFIDANVLVYFLDETAGLHGEVIAKLQELLDAGTELYTSHHVLEEVLFVVSRLSPGKESVATAIQQVAQIPNLKLAEPAAEFAFAERYIQLYRDSKVGINNTLLLQLMVDSGIARLFSYDEKMLQQANSLGIQRVI